MSQIEVDKVIPQSGTALQVGESGDTITIPAGATITNNGTANGFGSADTEKVKVSSNDTTAGFLNGKLVAGTNISLTEGSDGGNETLTAAFTGTIALNQMATGTDGNIISYDASGNPVAVATGSAGQVLTSAGAGAPPTFATAASGKIAQVLTTLTQTASETNSGNSWGDLMSLAITPSASTSKILVLFNVNISCNTNNHVGIKVVRGSTDINAGNSGSGTRDCFTAIRHMSDDQYHVSNFAGQVLDSPNTTSATTYYVKGNGNDYYYFNRSFTNSGTTTIQRPRTSSSLTLLEVLA